MTNRVSDDDEPIPSLKSGYDLELVLPPRPVQNEQRNHSIELGSLESTKQCCSLDRTRCRVCGHLPCLGIDLSGNPICGRDDSTIPARRRSISGRGRNHVCVAIGSWRSQSHQRPAGSLCDVGNSDAGRWQRTCLLGGTVHTIRHHRTDHRNGAVVDRDGWLDWI